MNKKDINIKKKIINTLMKNGKKEKSEILFFQTIKNLQRTTHKNHVEIIKTAVSSLIPALALKKTKNKSRRRTNYLPYILKEGNRIKYAIKNVIKNLEKKKAISETLYLKLLENSKEDSIVKQQIFESHEEALKYKKYSKYRWFL